MDNYLVNHVQIKPIPGFFGYFVDNFGVIYTSGTTRKDGKVVMTGDISRVRPLSTHLTGGYKMSGIRIPSQKRNKTMYSHEAVLLAFSGPRPSPKHCARHLDCDKLNNHISNLKWGTPAENVEDTIRMNRKPRGDQLSFSKVSDEQVRQIRLLRKAGESRNSVAARFGVNANWITNICTTKPYRARKHVR